MKLRTKLSSAAVTVALVGSIVVGSAAPASASVALPTCAHMFDDPAGYWNDFASINGSTGVPYYSSLYYGSDNADLRTEIIVWHGVNCNWHLATSTTRNFSVSETPINSVQGSWLRNWYSSHGIVGRDATATLGGPAYQVSKTELDVLWENKVWIAITSRGTSVEGYTMQSAGYTLYDLNPS